MPPRTLVVRMVRVTYHPTSSKASVCGWYLSYFPLYCCRGVAVKAIGEFNIMYVRVLSSVTGCILNGEGSD